MSDLYPPLPLSATRSSVFECVSQFLRSPLLSVCTSFSTHCHPFTRFTARLFPAIVLTRHFPPRASSSASPTTSHITRPPFIALNSAALSTVHCPLLFRFYAAAAVWIVDWTVAVGFVSSFEG